MSRHSPHPDQTNLTFGQRAELEHLIEARASIQAHAQALRWRLRLVTMESAMMAAFLFGGSLALHQSWLIALRNAALMGGSCLLIGVLTVGLASFTGQLLSHSASCLRTWLDKRGNQS